MYGEKHLPIIYPTSAVKRITMNHLECCNLIGQHSPLQQHKSWCRACQDEEDDEEDIDDDEEEDGNVRGRGTYHGGEL